MLRRSPSPKGGGSATSASHPKGSQQMPFFKKSRRRFPPPARRPGRFGKAVRRDAFRGEDGFGGLRGGVDDHPIGDAPQSPAGGDAVELALGIPAVGSRAEDRSIGQAFELSEDGIIDAIEHPLHPARRRGWTFGDAVEETAPPLQKNRAAPVRGGHLP